MNSSSPQPKESIKQWASSPAAILLFVMSGLAVLAIIFIFYQSSRSIRGTWVNIDNPSDTLEFIQGRNKQEGTIKSSGVFFKSWSNIGNYQLIDENKMKVEYDGALYGRNERTVEYSVANNELHITFPTSGTYTTLKYRRKQ